MGADSVEAIRCRNLSKRFKGRSIINNANFSLSKGVNVLVGHNGAGKSTLFYLITGIIRPDSGEAMINGIDSWKGHREAMKGVTFMPEKLSVLGGTSVREHIYWFASLNGTGIESIIDYIYLFGIDYTLPATFQSLSMGEMQLVMLACYLSTNSSIFILDEPNSNVDVNKRAVITTAIWEKAHKSNSLFLISTHLFDEMLTIYDGLLMLENGKIRYFSERGSLSISVIRTSNNDLMLNLIREIDHEARLINGSIFTSLGIQSCAEIASGHSVEILYYFYLPAQLRSLYE